MENSSQLKMAQPSQQEMTHGLPQGYPPTREHLHDADAGVLDGELQRRLDEIEKQNFGEVPR